MRNEKGSVIVETSLVFPLVILVMLAFSVLIRYFVVYETLQHAMYETTREVSAYYYLYSTTGLEKTSNAISKEAQRAEEELDMLAEPLNATINNMRNISAQLSRAKSDLGNVDANFTMSDVDKIRESVDGLVTEAGDLKENLGDSVASIQLIMESPLEAMTYLLKTGAGDLIEWSRNSLMNLIAKAFMNQHVPGKNIDKYVEAYGIRDFHTAMAWNNKASGDVELVLTYRFTVRLFNGIDFQVIQKTSTKGWGLGV